MRNINYEVDVVRLYANKLPGLEGTDAWNSWLTKCFKEGRFDELVNFRFGLQMGMDKANKKCLVTEDMAAMFCRWTSSIEKTLRKIVKSRDDLYNDKVLRAVKDNGPLQQKRDRDVDLELYLQKHNY